MSIHVICYHRVLPEVSDDLGTVDAYHHERGMLHSLADFRRQLDILQDRCQVVDAAGFLRARNCEGHAKSSVLLTFDDGYADFFTIIMPELSARGLPCVLFPTKAPVMTGYVPPRDQVYALLAADYRGPRRLSPEERKSWVSGHHKSAMLRLGPNEQARLISDLASQVGGEPSPPAPCHLTETQLKLLPASVYLGAHGLYHHEFGSLGADELRAELAVILEWVARVRPAQPHGVWLAYPNGKDDREERPGQVVQAVSNAGVNYAFTAKKEVRPAKATDLKIPRIFSQDGVDYLRPIWEKKA
jgi:peptidoglycan/xylan/chitin deacetylase (PgdA/CDA1 family)